MLVACGFATLAYALGAVVLAVYRSLSHRRRFAQATAHFAQPAHTDGPWGYVPALRKHANHRLAWFHDAFRGHDNLRLMPPLVGDVGRIVTEDPQVVKHILSSRLDVYLKRYAPMPPPVDLMFELVGDGIFGLDHGPRAPDHGQRWQAHRKATSLLFTHRNFQHHFTEVFVRNAEEVVRVLMTQGTDVVDMQRIFYAYTMDSFGEIGFGQRFGTLQGRPSTFAHAFDEAHALVMEFDLRAAVWTRVLQLFLPWPVNRLALWLALRCHPMYREFRRHVRAFRTEARDIVAAARAASEEEATTPRTVLEHFLHHQAVTDNTIQSDDDALVDVVVNLLIAGRDTTASLATWTLYELMQHPNIKARLVAELTGAGGHVYEHVRGLPYLDAVVHEALRLHPPVPIDRRVAAVDDTLPDGTRIPRGTRVLFFPWGMGRDTRRWGPDAHAFRPERWLVRGPTKPSAYEFPVFQAGSRMCLGKDMALLEVKILLYTLLRAPLRWERVVVEDAGAPFVALTMSMKHGLPVRVVAAKPHAD